MITPADSKLCPVKAREIEIWKLMTSCDCSRNEAWISRKGRSSSFSSAAGVGQNLAGMSMQQMIDASVEKPVSRALDYLITTLVPAFVQFITEQLAQCLANKLSRPTPSLSAEICQEGTSDAICTLASAPEAPPTSTDSPIEFSSLNFKRRVELLNSPDRFIASGNHKTKNRGVNTNLGVAVSSIIQDKDELGSSVEGLAVELPHY